MIINPINLNNPLFQGIAKPYTNKYGFKVIPISKDPNQKEIEDAINVTKIEPAHTGCSGRAYFWGEDLVVKEYLRSDKTQSRCPQKEINALDKLYDMGINSDSIQQGRYAFSSPDGKVYLVSTRIGGENAGKNNKFNSKNLASLINTMNVLDTPRENTKPSAQCGILMHYDLSEGNINISNETGGVFDFECLEQEDIEALYLRQQLGQYSANPNISDIPSLVTNLRGFEYRNLYRYLNNVEESEARAIFDEYLHLKGTYYANLASKLIETSKNGKLDRALCQMLSAACYRNAILLQAEKINPDIKKAEAIKIQIADFIYEQSPYQKISFKKINPQQIKSYIGNAILYFEQMRLKYKSWKYCREYLYFKDCLELMKNWYTVCDYLDYQSTKPDLEKLLKELQGTQSKEKIRKIYTSQKADYNLFMSKLTDKNTTTLDEILCS